MFDKLIDGVLQITSEQAMVAAVLIALAYFGRNSFFAAFVNTAPVNQNSKNKVPVRE